MRKWMLGMMLLLTMASAAFSQTNGIVVSGRVMEGDTKAPAMQATVQLLALPDSSQAAGVASSNDGYFKLPRVKPGKYLLKVSYIGYKSRQIPMWLAKAVPVKDIGTLTLESDAVMLAEAVVVAEAPQVQVVEDTVAFNSSAYRTPEGAMLEELVKKLPGAEIDEDGNVKINGKEVKKIMVDGKEFFGGDVKTGLKNLPVEMIDKLKTYDKKSDLARITGIDDGEEETVLDLTVKKGMNRGLFGNVDLAAGTEDRYIGRAMVNYFQDKTQVTLIAGANNVNDQGFSAGGGGPRWRRSNGLTATKELGLNFATESEKLDLGGSVQYNYRGNDASSTGYAENFLNAGASSSFSNSNSLSANTSQSFRADFRLEWKPDTLTNIIFRPNVSYSKTESSSASMSGTFSQDPFGLVANPNDYLDLKKLAEADLMQDDPLKDIRVNTSNSESYSDGHSLSANATLQLNRKLNARGRNITLREHFSYGDSDDDQFSSSDIWYFQQQEGSGLSKGDPIRRYITSPKSNYSLTTDLTYSEPIAKAIFLQFKYRFKYSYSENDKSTYDLIRSETGWEMGDELPADYADYKDKNQSKYAEYKTYNHEAMVGLRVIRPLYQLNAGMSFQPQNTRLTYRKGETDTVSVRHVFNFSPNIDLRFRFSKVSQLRFIYRGSSSQPGMENLLPITDNSNPLNIRVGNPDLKPSFSHNIRLFYNNYLPDKQRSVFTHASFQTTRNSISNSRAYNEETGGWTVTPKNINGNWNAFGMFGFNTALKNKKFNVGTHTFVRYANNVGFLTSGKGEEAVEQKNTTTDLKLSERLNATFRNDWLELGVNGSFSYTIEKDKLTPKNNQEPYDFSYGAFTTVTAPWSMSLSTNISNQSRRGFSDASMNRNELIWNAQLSQTFLKGAATVSFEMYDILRQQSNISRSLTSSGRSVYQYNGVNSYCMVHFIYRLNIFGGKNAQKGMHGPGRGFGPGHRGGFGPRRF